jgi:glutathione S-transferase
MILLGASVSPFVRKVLVAAEKGMKLDNRTINPSTSTDPLFLSISPFRKIPALVDGDFKVADSTAIITYFEALQPLPAVLPTAPRERARAIWFEEVADTILFPAGQRVFFNRVVAPKFLRRAGDRPLPRRRIRCCRRCTATPARVPTGVPARQRAVDRISPWPACWST